MSDALPSLSERIPELHYDIIARLIPGAIALAAFGGHLHKWPSSAVEIGLTGALCYVVGLALEQIANHFIDWCIWDPVCKRRHKQHGFFPKPNGDVWNHRNTTKGPRNAIIFKMLAERSLFRSLMLLSALATIFPPKVVSGNRLVGLVCLFVSFHTFYWLSRWLSWQVYTDVQLLNQKEVAGP